jgi:hypothetical protein
MNLSYKAIQFIIGAIEYQIQAYQERLNQEDLDEDEASDIMNDSGFLEALCKDFKENLSQGTTADAIKPYDRSSEGLIKQAIKLSVTERLSLLKVITESISKEVQPPQSQEVLSENTDSFTGNPQADIILDVPIHNNVPHDDKTVLIYRDQGGLKGRRIKRKNGLKGLREKPKKV